MFLSHVVNPRRRTIVKVSDGFDRARELTCAETLELHTLWQDMGEPDTLVDVIYSHDAEGAPRFRLRLTCAGSHLEHIIAGNGVLIACGAVPEEQARQLSSSSTLEAVVEYLRKPGTMVSEWLKSEIDSDRRKPAKRADADRRTPRRGNVASRK